MKYRLHSILAGSILVFALQGAHAVSLKDVYREAMNNDPAFQEALANRNSSRENLPQAIAGLLPNVQFDGNARNERFYAVIGSQNSVTYAGAHDYTLSLVQPVFNYGNIARFRQAESVVKQADATFLAAQLDLITRVSRAYFKVLQEEDTLRFTRAEKRANYRQLEQAKQRFKVGLDAITSVYDAQSAYDTTVANEITAQNNVKNAMEQLREITGVYHEEIQSIREQIPLIRPNPLSVEQWVDATLHQNFLIQAAHYALDVAKENIQVNFAGNFPVLNVISNYMNSNIPRVGFGTTGTETSNIGLQLRVPVYEGGMVTSQTRQARFDCQAAAATYERTMREQVSLTRQAYNNVIAGIANIQANRQAIVSALSSVESSEAALRVGTRTIVDVLDAQKTLFDAERNHAAAQYDYINNMFVLKQAAGILSEDDIDKISRWLVAHRPTEASDYVASKEIKAAQDRLFKELNVPMDPAVTGTVKSKSTSTKSSSGSIDFGSDNSSGPINMGSGPGSDGDFFNSATTPSHSSTLPAVPATPAATGASALTPAKVVTPTTSTPTSNSTLTPTSNSSSVPDRMAVTPSMTNTSGTTSPSVTKMPLHQGGASSTDLKQSPLMIPTTQPVNQPAGVSAPPVMTAPVTPLTPAVPKTPVTSMPPTSTGSPASGMSNHPSSSNMMKPLTTTPVVSGSEQPATPAMPAFSPSAAPQMPNSAPITPVSPLTPPTLNKSIMSPQSALTPEHTRHSVGVISSPASTQTATSPTAGELTIKNTSVKESSTPLRKFANVLLSPWKKISATTSTHIDAPKPPKVNGSETVPSSQRPQIETVNVNVASLSHSHASLNTAPEKQEPVLIIAKNAKAHTVNPVVARATKAKPTSPI